MKTRAELLFEDHQNAIYRRTDRMFAVLMAIEYIAGIIAALVISPRTWSGDQSSIHIHVLSAIFLGAVILGFPIALTIWFPGRAFTRHVVAIGQMLDSALLIHLTGGRVETHFHIFGSLAFLAFYRDWRVLISASSVVALDHIFRGIYWPESVYGVLSASSFRWIEHTAWVAFEDIFIALGIRQSIREMREIAERRAFVEQVAQERANSIAELEDTKKKLNDALSAKTTFMSVCGHELKTPLTSMGLQSQWMERALKKGDAAALSPERVAKMAIHTSSQVKRLLRLVDDMLDHSRIQMGKLQLTFESVDLSMLVHEVVGRFQLQAEAIGCPIWVEEGAPLVGHWDRFRIEQVVSNLISNAIKYGAGKPIEVGLTQAGKEAVIFVRDHGIGIAPEDQAKIFDQFERVSHSSHISGLGLGLYITKSIVEQHQGNISIESEPGQGSRFTVKLPLSSSPVCN